MRELSQEDIDHCLFLAQIEVGIYVPIDAGKWYLNDEYFALRPTIYFVKGHDKSELYQRLARKMGTYVVTYQLSPEFCGRKGYARIKRLDLEKKL